MHWKRNGSWGWALAAAFFGLLGISTLGCSSTKTLKVQVIKGTSQVNNGKPIKLDVLIPHDKRIEELETMTIAQWFDRDLSERMDFGQFIISMRVNPDDLQDSELYCLDHKSQDPEGRIAKMRELYDKGSLRMSLSELERATLSRAERSGLFVWAEYLYGEDKNYLATDQREAYCKQSVRRLKPEDVAGARTITLSFNPKEVLVNCQGN